jgi:uncharacterized protein involved in exopolysaccharide biosynthesis
LSYPYTCSSHLYAINKGKTNNEKLKTKERIKKGSFFMREIEDEEMSLQDYIRVLRKRKWTVFTVVITALLVVLIANFFMSPVYKATTTILISQSGAQLFGGADEIKTKIEILKSYSIAQGVAEKLSADIFEKVQAENFEKKRESFGWLINILDRLYSKIKNVVASIIVANKDKNNNIEVESHFKDTIKQIRDSITVNLVKNTNMIEISSENNNPELAAEIANTIAAVFVDKSLIINRSKASEVKKFIEEQLLEKEKELAEEEEKLQYEKRLEKLPDKELRLARLERAVRVSENMYLLLLEKYQEARINEVMELGDIRVIDQALIPEAPIKPNKKLNLVIGGILGLMLGVTMVFFLEYMDNTIKNTEDVERILNLPILGVIPKDTPEKKKKRKRKHQ